MRSTSSDTRDTHSDPRVPSHGEDERPYHSQTLPRSHTSAPEIQDRWIQVRTGGYKLVLKYRTGGYKLAP